MSDDNPLLTLFEKLLKNKDEKKVMELIISEKSKEEILEALLKEDKK